MRLSRILGTFRSMRGEDKKRRKKRNCFFEESTHTAEYGEGVEMDVTQSAEEAVADDPTASKPGPWKRHAADSKLRASCPTLTRRRGSKSVAHADNTLYPGTKTEREIVHMLQTSLRTDSFSFMWHGGSVDS